jgi:hypothetical protein
MKTTIEIPDDLYRQVEEKSALEGRAVREVTEELFRLYLDPDREGPQGTAKKRAVQQGSRLLDGEPLPTWFGVLEKYVRQVKKNDMESIRESIAAGITEERDL